MAFTEFAILFQNKDFLAVDKPAGISVHNNEDPQNVIGVLQSQLEVEKLFPVHRLDKETSGVQIIALNSASAKILADAFEQRAVRKIYQGLLRGALKEDQGSWTQSLTDKGEGRRNPAGAAKERVPCETQFRVLQKTPYFTFCEFNLITGRQHQIRKHAAVVNHALVGDPRYGDERYNKKMAQIYKTSRMFLHCAKIEISGQSIESPLPQGFIL
jgi:RluA family pseudouridine synthase